MLLPSATNIHDHGINGLRARDEGVCIFEEVVDTTLSSEGVANVTAPNAKYVCRRWDWGGKGQSLGTRWMALLNR